MAATIRDVAARAGVSVSTVSCALRGKALVKPATRLRIVRAADDLGYRPEPAGAVLASHRRATQSRPKPLTLGWVLAERMTTRRSEAFESRCAALGYDVAPIDLTRFRSGAESSRALWYQNVRGLYFASPSSFPASFLETGFDWSRFAVVKFSRARPELPIHLIRHSPYDYAHRCLQEIFRRGYRRVAALIAPSASRWDDDARIAAIAGFRETGLPRDAVLEWKCLDLPSHPTAPLPAACARWLRSVKPDAIVAFPAQWFFQVRATGGSIGRTPFASMVTSSSDVALRDIAGCDARLANAASMAADLLNAAILSGDFGLASEPREHVIEPLWTDAPSMPAR